MSGKVKVVVAMSGGVDSSVAAALLREEGYEVIGATMEIWPPEKGDDNDSRIYCGVTAVTDARRVAHQLGIRHYVMNLRDIFARKVIEDFCQEYSRGRTPNPCIRCNHYIKFGALLERAAEIGADFLATGHHARIERETAGAYFLKKGKDVHKDQSYFLYCLTQERMRRILFPIGNFTKDMVRQKARELGLPVADKPESQEICFIPNNNYVEFLKIHIPESATPGPILDRQGKILGRHQGIMHYTIGQRHGLGIAVKKPLYVTTIEPEQNAVVVGNKEAVYCQEQIASDLNWINGSKPECTINVKAKIRYRHTEAEATVTPLDDGRAHVKFSEPQMAITPGQAVVFYDGDVVIGGGTINRQGS